MMRKAKFSFKRLSMVDTLLIAIISGLIAFSAVANELRDPTQLPQSIASSNQQNNDGNSQVVQYGPVLQSVILSSQSRAAIISGKHVKIGEKFQDERLVSVTENTAILRGSNGVNKTLTMQHNNIKQLQKTSKTAAKDRLSGNARTVTQHINVR